jgi:molybdopterin/thiamine biosynthesis adenylyltransferase
MRNLTALNLAEQERVCRARVFICGCGGLGGTLINLLSRAGVGYLRLVDCDSFAPSNLNRQWLSEVANLSRPKAEIAREKVAAINPFVEVEAMCMLMEEHEAESLVAGTDLVLDALDNIDGRFVLAEAAARVGVPFIHAAVAGWWGQITTFLPGSGAGLRKVYGNRRRKDAAEEAAGVLGPTAAVIGSLQAFEALRLLAGRTPIYENRLLYFDGESGSIEILPL